MPSFTAIDVETASFSRASICQIGIVVVRQGRIVLEHTQLVDPECAFMSGNIAIHGIRPADVRGATTFHAVNEWLHSNLPGELAVAHSSFDEQCLNQSAERYALPRWQARWADSVVAAKRAFPELRQQGYRLKTLADQFGIALNHHDALSDARASAKIFLRALEETRLRPEDFVGLRLAPRRFASPRAQARVAALKEMAVTPTGTIVFTGQLQRFERVEAEALAACTGLQAQASVTATTSHLCMGQRAEANGKYRKAMSLRDQGHAITLLDETGFVARLERLAPAAFQLFRDMEAA